MRPRPAPTADVSVVIPCLDDGDMLAVCLDHLARQECLPREVVVVDNASTPSPGLVEAAGFPFEIRVVHEPVQGVASAASRGYDEAKGAILARCDADSRPGPTWVSALVRALAADPRLAAVTGPVAFHDLSGWRSLAGHAFYRAGLGLGMHLAIARTPLWGSNLALRRSAWEDARARVHRDDPRVHDDLDLSFALGPQARVRRVRDMRVTAEARIYGSGSQVRSRVVRALHSCRRGWEHQGPGPRWVVRLSRGRLLTAETDDHDARESR